jgi:lactate dehydrogenase-like 2-hydroxyacid dehydrogenase
MKPKIFVVQPIPGVALDILRGAADVSVYPYLDRQISTDELVINAMRSDWLFVLGDTIVPADVINANPNLKGIGALTKAGANIDMAAARARKLPVVAEDPADRYGEGVGTAVRGGVSLATADLTVGMIVALAYRIVESDRYTRCGHFKQEQTLALMGLGCPERTVGLIGLGKVAEYMVPRVRAFDMNIIYTKRNRLPAAQEREWGPEWTASLDDLLSRSDFVCVACDYNESTHKLIGARQFALMKNTAYFINTARGRIVDEPEMIRALQNRTIAGAALDVYWDEPPETHDPHVPEALHKLDNVILAPHNGGATWPVRGARMASVARGILRMMKGEPPPGLLNPEIFA